MDEAAIERLRIAVKILSSPYNHNEKVTEAEIATLKSYLGGDLTNLPAEDIAAAVIRRELKLESKHEVPGPHGKIKRNPAPPERI